MKTTILSLFAVFTIYGCGDASTAIQAAKDAIDPVQHSENCLQEKDGFKSENGGCQIGNLVLAPLQTTELTQSDAIASCSALQLSGYFDWSIPTLDQLKSILSASQLKDDYNLNGAHLDGIPFFFTNSETLDVNGSVAAISPKGTIIPEAPASKSPYFCVRVASE